MGRGEMGLFETAWRARIDHFHRTTVHRSLTKEEAENDREIAHERAIYFAERFQANPILMALMSHYFTYRDSILQLKLGNLDIPNPLGIAASFDKNACIPRLLGDGLGFGVVTVGSITKIPYAGNPRPRVFDLSESDGLINRMGFPGDGIDSVETRLKTLPQKRDYALVINIAASKPSFDLGTSIEDYVSAFLRMHPFGDALEINVSSPNTPGVRGLQEPEVFEDLAQEVYFYRNIDRSPRPTKKPIIYKFSPDLPQKQLEQLLTIAIDNGADGVTLTNTSTDTVLRDSLKGDQYKNEVGGISGAPLGAKALEVTHNAYSFAGDKLFIIRAGGVSGTAANLWESLTYGGASMAEVYTAFVRPTTSTPNFTVYALKEFARAMRTYGLSSMEEFQELRGRKIPYPFDKRYPFSYPFSNFYPDA